MINPKIQSSNILGTWNGYYFQIQIALFLFLGLIIGHEIKEFYVDFPLNKRKSIDIFYIDTKNNAHYYEVKASLFAKLSTTTIKEALHLLYDIFIKVEDRKNVFLYLIYPFRAWSTAPQPIKVIETYKNAKTSQEKNNLLKRIGNIILKSNNLRIETIGQFIKQLRLNPPAMITSLIALLMNDNLTPEIGTLCKQAGDKYFKEVIRPKLELYNLQFSPTAELVLVKYFLHALFEFFLQRAGTRINILESFKKDFITRYLEDIRTIKLLHQPLDSTLEGTSKITY